MLEFQPDKIVLGCTHYPYLIKDLKKYVKEDIFIDPAKIFVEYIKKDLESLNSLNDCIEEGFHEFYVSANPEAFMENSSLFYDLKEIPNLV